MKVRPHLPVGFIKSLKLIENTGESTSYDPTFHVVRLDIVNPFDKDFHANTLLEIPRMRGAGSPVYRCTYLHDAVYHGDVILACEMIRLGSDVDVRDSRGCTPLLIGTMRLEQLARTSSSSNRPPSPSHSPYSRISTIIRTLLEHLADANCITGGRTPLHYACDAQDWELVSLLINYGAKPSLRGADQLIPSLKATDAQRVHTFLSQYDRIKDGAPRKRSCPCFSGLLLEDCHAKREQPYPEHHACPTGLGCQGLKPYSECCLPRRIQALEAWDVRTRRIKTTITKTIYPDPEEDTEDHPLYELREKLALYFSGGLNLDGDVIDIMRFFVCDNKTCPEGLNERARHAYKKLGDYCARALSEDVIDPAFRYALKRASFIPWPVGRQRTKAFCRERQGRWNALVDRYIDKKGDSRSRHEIERAAKLGKYLDAYVPSCDSPDCRRSCLRNDEGKVLMRCTRCKMSTYCTEECQQSDWKRHKRICGKPGQRRQASPSQVLLDEYIWKALVAELSVPTPENENNVPTTRE